MVSGIKLETGKVERFVLPIMDSVYSLYANILQLFSFSPIEAYYISPSVFILSGQKSETFC
jgi:hypothetical protein